MTHFAPIKTILFDAGEEEDLPLLNRVQAGILLEVLKDMLLPAASCAAANSRARSRYGASSSQAGQNDGLSSSAPLVSLAGPRKRRGLSRTDGAGFPIRQPDRNPHIAEHAHPRTHPSPHSSGCHEFCLRQRDALGMRHHDRDAPVFVGQAADAVQRTVRIRRVGVGNITVVIDVAQWRPCTRPNSDAALSSKRPCPRHARSQSAFSTRPCRPGIATGSRRLRRGSSGASNCSDLLRRKRGQLIGARNEVAQVRQHLAAVADTEGKRIAAIEKTRRTGRECASGKGSTWPSRRRHRARHRTRNRRRQRGPGSWTGVSRPSRMIAHVHVDVTAKPARMNAAAISYWLLTPCSRRIATRGRAAPAIGRETSSLPDRRTAVTFSPGSAVVEDAVELFLRRRGIVSQRLDAIARLRPLALQSRCVRFSQQFGLAVANESEPASVPRRGRSRSLDPIPIEHHLHLGAACSSPPARRRPASSLKSCASRISRCEPLSCRRRPRRLANIISATVASSPPSLRS